MTKFSIFSGILMISLQSFAQTPNLSACTDLVKIEQESVVMAEEHFAVGEVTRIEVNQARMNLFKTQFDCRSILFSDYCKLAVPTAENILTSLLEEVRTGQREIGDTQTAKSELIRVQSLCL